MFGIKKKYLSIFNKNKGILLPDDTKKIVIMSVDSKDLNHLKFIGFNDYTEVIDFVSSFTHFLLDTEEDVCEKVKDAFIEYKKVFVKK